MPVTITVRVGDKLVNLVDEIAKKECLIEQSLGDCENGRLDLWQVAERCHLSLWEMIIEVGEGKTCVPYLLGELREDLKSIE